MNLEELNKDIVIKIDLNSGTESVLKSRQSTEQYNLDVDDKVYEIIQNWSLDKDDKIECSPINGKWHYKEFKGLSRAGKPQYKSQPRISRILNTIVSRIEKNFDFYRRVLNFDEINIEAIQQFASDYLKSPDSQRIQLCTQSSRQGVDEKTQIEFIREASKNQNGVKVIKPNEGDITIDNAELNQRKNVKDKKAKARSVDVVVEQGVSSAYGFLKYSGPEGSVTSELQSRETVQYLEEAIKYCNTHSDDNKFFLQIDGKTGERLVLEYQKKIPSNLSNRVFAGTSQDVVAWLGLNK